MTRILTVQDISCVGQCSLTVALPILSACGLETCVLPCAVLSTHTGFSQGCVFRDLTEEMPKIQAHWQREGICFQAIYTGYLGSIQQIHYVQVLFHSTSAAGCLKIVDPAMADHGRLYDGFDSDFVNAMAQLCAQADYLIPNLTEACLLTGIPYQETYDRDYIHRLLTALAALGCKRILLTGVSCQPDMTGVVLWENGAVTEYQHEKLPSSRHGTGDIFASAFVGARMRGKSTVSAMQIAADFTVACLRATAPEHWYGTTFEPCLKSLIEILETT